MPASARSPIPAALDQLAHADLPAPLAVARDLHCFLVHVPGPRDPRGRHYPLTALVTAAAASVLTGARSLAAIGEWITDAPCWVLRAVGFRPDPLTGSVTASCSPD